MFSSAFQLRSAFIRSPAALRLRFYLCALLNTLLMPVTLLFLLVMFVFQHAEVRGGGMGVGWGGVRAAFGGWRASVPSHLHRPLSPPPPTHPRPPQSVNRQRLDILRRRWTTFATWRFREYNELPHYFERRMNASYEPASKYEQQFASPVLTILARCARVPKVLGWGWGWGWGGAKCIAS